MTTGSSIPASDGNGETECEHEWIHTDEYDSNSNTERDRLECRLCGMNAGDNVSETRVHSYLYKSIQFPDVGFEKVFSNPIRFGGTGLNTWYPYEE